MCSVVVVIGEVGTENPLQMSFVENDHVSKALAPDGAENPFGLRILPWRSRCRDNIFDAHVLDSILEVTPVDSVTVTNQKLRRCVVREGLDNLLRSPLGRWMLSDVEVQDAPTVMAVVPENGIRQSRCKKSKRGDRTGRGRN